MLRKTASLMNYVQVLLICSVKCRLVLLCLFFNVLLGNLELDLFCLLWMHIHILFYQPKIADWLFAHVSELIRVSLVVLTCFSFVVYAVALLLQTDWNPWYIMLLTLYGCIEYDLWSIDIEILYFLCDCDISVLLIAHTVFGCYAGKMVSFVYIPIYVYLSFLFYLFVGASKYCCPACRPHWYHINNGGK